MTRFLLAVVWLAVVADTPAMARDGAEAHELVSTRHDGDPITNSLGCGRGRYRDRDPHTHTCIGPADLRR
jgi:hypothetical protein